MLADKSVMFTVLSSVMNGAIINARPQTEEHFQARNSIESKTV